VVFLHFYLLASTFLCLSVMKHIFTHNSLTRESYQCFVSYYVLLGTRGSCSFWSTGYSVAFFYMFFPWWNIFNLKFYETHYYA
jgi:hypothetical protein